MQLVSPATSYLGGTFGNGALQTCRPISDRASGVHRYNVWQLSRGTPKPVTTTRFPVLPALVRFDVRRIIVTRCFWSVWRVKRNRRGGYLSRSNTRVYFNVNFNWSRPKTCSDSVERWRYGARLRKLTLRKRHSANALSLGRVFRRVAGSRDWQRKLARFPCKTLACINVGSVDLPRSQYKSRGRANDRNEESLGWKGSWLHSGGVSLAGRIDERDHGPGG